MCPGHVYNVQIQIKNVHWPHICCSLLIYPWLYSRITKKMATCNCVSLEEVLPIMHYNIPTMHWQRQSELHLQSECQLITPPGSVSRSSKVINFTFKVSVPPQDQCRSTLDPQGNPNFTFKVSVDCPPQDQCRSTLDPQVNPNFTFKVSVDRSPPQDQCRSTPDPQGNPNFTFTIPICFQKI